MKVDISPDAIEIARIYENESKVFAEEVRNAIRECRDGNYESYDVIDECTPMFEDILSDELTKANVTREELAEWKCEYDDICGMADVKGDYNMMHPDETEEEFWDHED